MTQTQIPFDISRLVFFNNYKYIEMYSAATDCFYQSCTGLYLPTLLLPVKTNALCPSGSHVSREVFQGKVVLVYAAVLS